MARLSKLILCLLALACLGGTWIASPGKGSHGGAAVFAEVQQKNYASTASATTHNLVFSSAPTQGNLIIICVCGDGTVTTPSGYTADFSNNNNQHQVIFRKIAGASESATVPLVMGVSTSLCAIGFEYSGMAASTPFDKSAFNNSSGGFTTNATGTTATTTQAAELLIASQTWIGAGLVSSWSNSFVSEGEMIATGSATNVIMNVATREVSATGAYTSTATFTTTTTNPQGAIATFKKF